MLVISTRHEVSGELDGSEPLGRLDCLVRGATRDRWWARFSLWGGVRTSKWVADGGCSLAGAV